MEPNQELEATAEAPEERELSPGERLLVRAQRRQHRIEDFKATAERMKEVEEARQADGPTFLGETGKAVWGAGVDIVSEGAMFAADVLRSLPPVRNFQNMMVGITEDMSPIEASAKADDNWKMIQESWRAGADVVAPENETMLGAGARGIITFAAPYIGMAKVGGAANWTQAAGRGFIIDTTLFDPNQGNLSNLIQSLDPEQQSVVLDFLATDPDDSDSLNRLRNGFEGVVLGTMLEAVFRFARWGINKIKVDEAHEAADAITTSLDDVRAELEADDLLAAEGPAPAPDVPPTGSSRGTDDAADAGSSRGADDAADDAAEAGAGSSREGAAEADPIESLRSTLRITPAQRDALKQALIDGDDDKVSQLFNQDFNFDTFNWNSIEDADGIRKVINVVSDVMADHIDNVAGGTQSHVQTKRLANLVGSTGDEIHRLFTDVRSGPGIAARFHAAQRVLLASAKEAMRLGKVAKQTGNISDRAAAIRQLELHAALQAEIKGAQKEIARALNGMAIIKNEAANGFKEFEQMMNAFGNTSGRGQHSFDQMLDELMRGDSLEAFNANARTFARGGRVTNIVMEYAINAMLSSPKTHVLNFASNMLNNMLFSMDRFIAGSYRGMVHGDKAAFREAKIDIITKFSKLDEAWKLAKQAWRDGRPVADARQRLEFGQRKAIKMEGKEVALENGDEALQEAGSTIWNRKREVVRNSSGDVMSAIEFNPLQRAVNTLGNVVRIPGRALITGDEFWKAVTRNSEIAALSYREADRMAEAKGLTIGTDAYETFVEREMRALMDPNSKSVKARDIRVAAVEKSRLAAFQESPKTPGGALVEKAMNHNQWVKLIIAPFFRTPMNVIRQSLIDRTPLGMVIGETREIMKHGDPRAKAEAVTRMTSGVAAMAAVYPLINVGDDESKGGVQIVGKLAWDSSQKLAGVRDYSIQLGDTWYQFNRMDPVGSWLGMMADSKTHLENAGDEELGMAFFQGSLAAFMNNAVNKTWAKSFADIVDMITTISANKSENRAVSIEKALDKFAGQQVGKFIPQLVKSTGEYVANDDERMARESWEFLDVLQSQTPLLNQNLPPKHDVLGRPITWENSAYAVVSPIAASPDTDNPVEQEMFRLNFTIRPIPTTFQGGKVVMSAEDYSELTGLVGTVRVSQHGNLEETLKEFIASPRYQEWTDARKVMMLKEYVNAARAQARARFLMAGDRFEQFKDAFQKEQDALFTPPSP